MTPSPPPSPTLTQRARTLVETPLNHIGQRLANRGVHPDALTVLGLGIVAAAAVVIGAGYPVAGGVILLVGLPFDALDGAVARAMGRTDKFGALLDSTLDRYADGFIFCGIGYYFAVHDAFAMMLLALAALIGSYSVSYVRARGEGLGVSATVGWFSRLERTVVLLVGLLLVPLLPICLGVLAVGTHATALHRLRYLHKTLARREG